MKTIMKAVIILHNMIIENEQGLNLGYQYDIPSTMDHYAPMINTAIVDVGMDVGMIVDYFRQIRDTGTHYRLRNDLIEHLWQLKGEADD